jgi:dipeptidyl aminopeptidase/acylaminoacyl peptidase
MSIQASDLFTIPLFYWIDLAPDGRTMLYSSTASGMPHLYVLPTKPGSRPKQITSGNDPVMIGSLSPTGDRVVYLQDKDGNELHQLFLVSKNGGKPEQLTKNAQRTSNAKWHPNGEEVARDYVTKDSSCLEICSLKTRESFVLKEQKTPLFISEYSHDGKWIAVTEYGGGKDPKNMQVTVVNRKDPADTISYKFKDGSKEFSPSWSHDDKKLAFPSDVNGKNQIAIQDFQGTEHFLLSLNDEEEADDLQGPCWGPTDDRVYYAVNKHGRISLDEHQLSGKRTALPFPKGTIRAYGVSRDGKVIIALDSSLSSPHCVYLKKAGVHTAVPLTSRKCKVNTARLAQPRSVWYKSSDGLKIHGWYLPAAFGKPPHPAVVWVHGGPWAQILDRWDPFLQSLSQSGFAVLTPNFRGSTGYGAEFRNMDLSDPGGGDLEDTVSGTEWLIKQKEINKSKIAIWGASYGGYMTLMALVKKPRVFAAGVAAVPITDWQEMYELDDAVMRKFDLEMFGGSPKEKGELYRDRSPITHISKIKAPVMISCGRHDSRCPIQPVEKFVKKLEEMNHPHQFRVEEKEGHGFARVDAMVREVTLGVKYLKKTLEIGLQRKRALRARHSK